MKCFVGIRVSVFNNKIKQKVNILTAELELRKTNACLSTEHQLQHPDFFSDRSAALSFTTTTPLPPRVEVPRPTLPLVTPPSSAVSDTCSIPDKKPSH